MFYDINGSIVDRSCSLKWCDQIVETPLAGSWISFRSTNKTQGAYNQCGRTDAIEDFTEVNHE